MSVALVSSAENSVLSKGLSSDSRVFWKTYGRGSKIVIGLHGWSGDHRSFEPIIDQMPDDVTFISFDQPGFGQSQPPVEWNVRSIAEPIFEVLEGLPSTPMTIVGSCSGAVVGMELGMMLGPRVNRLLMIDPFMTAPWFFRLFCWGWLGKVCYYSTFANPLGRWLTNIGLAHRRTDDTSLTEHFESADHGRALGYLRALCDPALHHRGYERLDAIGEFVVGGRTFTSVVRSVEWWQKTRWPSAPLQVLPTAGHMPVHEATDDVARTVFGPGLRATVPERA
ncbi:MAG: alpha/beta hydrolase [Myxococcota bacterium]